MIKGIMAVAEHSDTRRRAWIPAHPNQERAVCWKWASCYTDKIAGPDRRGDWMILLPFTSPNLWVELLLVATCLFWPPLFFAFLRSVGIMVWYWEMLSASDAVLNQEGHWVVQWGVPYRYELNFRRTHVYWWQLLACYISVSERRSRLLQALPWCCVRMICPSHSITI